MQKYLLIHLYRDLTTERYHRLSDELLDHMVTKLEELADEIEMQGFDVEYNVSLVSRLQFCQKLTCVFVN